MKFLSNILYCNPIAFLSLLLVVVGVVFLFALLIHHWSSLHIKNSPKRIKKHQVALIGSVILIVIGILGIFITSYLSSKEISGAEYHKLITELNHYPPLNKTFINNTKKLNHINHFEYCKIMHDIDRNKTTKIKKLLLK